ncbi:MAG: redox-sensitive bicupin YhaK (pirin superfamily) [Myxococcota bacterium]|jgi:redox-sensitive bicupin YhaK (pirin superfamily)
MAADPVLAVVPLGTPPWPTLDPFLFAVHHLDAYPAGTEAMGPAASLAGRNIGMDFAGTDGWRMYHGDVIPGFPRHPHRGFETVTIARQGLIDHSDSMGATARFGHGDCQWMTAGEGVVHSEMFPLVHRDRGNPAELFQLWLNLPRADKMAPPHFTMLWDHTVPTLTLPDGSGRVTEVRVYAGAWGEVSPPAPPPNSWASKPDAAVAIWTLRIPPNGRVTLPAAPAGVNRVVYVFAGSGVHVAGAAATPPSAVQLRPDAEVELVNGAAESEVLVLQGRPIGEPVVQHGPFVMNTQGEIRQAMLDYQRTQFGGWPWPVDGPAHSRDQGRFAIHADGRREEPGTEG